jgi:hypothetical protein
LLATLIHFAVHRYREEQILKKWFAGVETTYEQSCLWRMASIIHLFSPNLNYNGEHYQLALEALVKRI